MHAAVEALVGPIAAPTSAQVQHYIDTGQIMCPSGGDTIQMLRLLPVWWTSDDGTRNATGWDWWGPSGPIWFQCWCDRCKNKEKPARWWPPEGWTDAKTTYS